mmetsp:Transcript_28509/g.90859  ORF Transcript_28509/g.90859 Transcript_28509/m.90859 type:complete len:214 (+) Transcript_28509:849-1490(+)
MVSRGGPLHREHVPPQRHGQEHGHAAARDYGVRGRGDHRRDCSLHRCHGHLHGALQHSHQHWVPRGVPAPRSEPPAAGPRHRPHPRGRRAQSPRGRQGPLGDGLRGNAAAPAPRGTRIHPPHVVLDEVRGAHARDDAGARGPAPCRGRHALLGRQVRPQARQVRASVRLGEVQQGTQDGGLPYRRRQGEEGEQAPEGRPRVLPRAQAAGRQAR